ncbi:MAG: hypothetical protein AUK63_2062, partial [bacterium P3]
PTSRAFLTAKVVKISELPNISPENFGNSGIERTAQAEMCGKFTKCISWQQWSLVHTSACGRCLSSSLLPKYVTGGADDGWCNSCHSCFVNLQICKFIYLQTCKFANTLNNGEQTRPGDVDNIDGCGLFDSA